MTILSPRLALNLNYLLLCCIAFCCAARAKPCHTTPPLSCHATVSLPALRLSCAGWLLHRLLSRCATISLAPAEEGSDVKLSFLLLLARAVMAALRPPPSHGRR